MSRPVFDALDRNWSAFAARPEVSAALDRWSATPELAAASLEDLVAAIWAADKADADRACAALAARAPADEIAARVLLQVLRPGLRNLGRRLALGASFDDVDHELLALAWERIRTYRVDRRPRSVAANILLDIRKAYVRGVLEPDRGLSNTYQRGCGPPARQPSTRRSTPWGPASAPTPTSSTPSSVAPSPPPARQ